MEPPEAVAATTRGATAMVPAAADGKRLRAQFLADPLVDDLRVRLALRLLHHLADEEAEQALLAAPERGDLARVRVEDLVDDRVELGGVGDGALREVRVGAEAVAGALGDRVQVDLARELAARRDHLRQLR